MSVESSSSSDAEPVVLPAMSASPSDDDFCDGGPEGGGALMTGSRGTVLLSRRFLRRPAASLLPSDARPRDGLLSPDRPAESTTDRRGMSSESCASPEAGVSDSSDSHGQSSSTSDSPEISGRSSRRRFAGTFSAIVSSESDVGTKIRAPHPGHVTDSPALPSGVGTGV